VRDLRLLMVGTVRIVSKRIIRERHKRPAGASTTDSPAGRRAVIELGHGGTRLEGGDLPLERLVDLDGVLVDVSGAADPIVGRAPLLPYDLRGRAVLIHTGRDAGALDDDAARHLVAESAALVGIDSPGPAHPALPAAGIPVCRHLAELAALPTEGFRFSAVPTTADGAVRTYATLSP
jgi:kynurenine formamidase